MVAPPVLSFRDSHLRRILQIERACFGPDAYTPGLFREWGAMRGSVFLVARIGRVIAGYVLGFAEKGKGEIISIAVDPKLQRSGVGGALMRGLLERLRAAGARSVELMVRCENASAIRFYGAFGFRRVRRAANYYEDGGDGWLMRKQADSAA